MESPWKRSSTDLPPLHKKILIEQHDGLLGVVTINFIINSEAAHHNWISGTNFDQIAKDDAIWMEIPEIPENLRKNDETR